MKIALLDIQTRETAINKTMAGGYGTSSKYSDSGNILIKILSKAKKKGVIIPLIDFAYLAAILKSQNNEIEVVHGNYLPKADIYIIYASLVEHKAELAVAEKIRALYPEAKIGFIGTLTMTSPSSFKDHADFVIQGESENYFLENNINNELKGLIQAGHVENLDSLPFPDWTDFSMEKFTHQHFFGCQPVYPVLTSRGCPFTCSYYCAYPMIAGKKVRYRSVENVLSELKYLKDKYNAGAILFRDANFTVDKERIKKLCGEIIKNKLDILWACETHPSLLDRSLVDIMYESGARAITIGVESRNKEVIEQSQRQDVEEKHLKEIVDYCEKKGIAIMAGYIFGHPNDTRESIEDTIRYAMKLNTTYAQFVISTPYPGTQYYESLKDDLTTEDWTKYDTYTLTFKHPNLSYEQLEELKCGAYIKYYYRIWWIVTRFIRRKINGFFNRR
jgi:radical SAM superfamily enzyme YgiQ (UPF0313 family)